MPGSPFAKSFVPGAEIDLSLFSHIHNDPFLAGTFQLEGNSFARTIDYLDRYCASLPSGLSPEVVALQKRMQKLVEVETAMEGIKQCPDSQTAESSLKKLAESIANELVGTLPIGEYLSLPGGWSAPGGSHAMVYQFQRTAKSLKFYIHNAGAGINYHERKSARDRELYYPVQAYDIPLPDDHKKLAGFIRDVLLPMLPGLRSKKEQTFNAEQLYEEVLPRIHFLDATLVSVIVKSEHAFTAGQLSGTCSQRAPHQMLKENFTSLQAYRQFIYQFKRSALTDYITTLERKKELHDQRVQTLVRHAMNTMVRTLNIPGLFTDEYIASERTALREYRELLQRVCSKDVVALEQVIVPKRSLPLFRVNSLPATLSSLISQPVFSLPVVDMPLRSLYGGPGLFAQMQELCMDCKRLNDTGQYTVIIEGLELVFAHFPRPALPGEFNHPLPFYQDITRDNQAEFYQLIASLQDSYLDACNKLGSDAVVPRMMAVGLSIVSILDYVTNQLPLNKAGSVSFHDILSATLGGFFKGNRNNPYFATNSPLLDTCIQSLKVLYPQSKYIQLVDYYAGIIDTEPALKQQLLERYVPPSDAAFSNLLTAGGYRELYCFTTAFDELSKESAYKPLIEKFNLQYMVEACNYKALQAFWGQSYEQNMRIKLLHSSVGIEANSGAYNTLWSTHNRCLLTHKYPLTDDTPCQRALAVDYPVHIVNHYGVPSRDNHTQLFPSEIASIPLEGLDDKTRSALTTRQIDKHEIAAREFFHLRHSPQNQIKLTLDYFHQHLHKLSERACQIYMEANLFEPGLLMTELDTNPDILIEIDRFIDAGLKHYAERGFISQQSLFFIRLAYLVNRYAAEYKPSLVGGRLQALQQQLSGFLQIEKENDAAIKQSVHQYQFLTAMARLKLTSGHMSAREKDEILDLTLPSYFYMIAKQNPDDVIDTSMQFELECVKHDFNRFALQSDSTSVGRLVGRALEQLGFGFCDALPIKTESFYTVRVQQGTVYRVDVGRGLVFNQAGMAYTPVPLDILHHPVMRFLSPQHIESCFTSSDGLVFEIGAPEPVLRFIRQSKSSAYRVQKLMTVGGYTQWYELHALNVEQQKAFATDSQIIELPFPAILKERESKVWLGCDDRKNLLITEGQEITYHCKQSILGEWQANQLNDDAMNTGFTLCPDVTWLHTLFATFEDPAFITVCQNTESYEVKFGRYGFTLLAREEGGIWEYRLQDNKDFTLLGNVDKLLPGVAGLIFENKTTKQRTCYLPLQQYICVGGPSAHSEFYHFQQDISGAIPRHVVQELTKGSEGANLLWQYTGRERVIRYPLNKDSMLHAERASDALYLCYVYLGSQHPERAWEVLEDCAKRLGGLSGTVEELTYLNMILNALPRRMKDEDKDATISTPAYVACQLKALALFTQAFTPDHVVSFPPQAHDLKTPDGLYQDTCWKEVQAFHRGLNETLYHLYSRFQRMQRHLDHGFLLQDDERKSLLDYYHFHLPKPTDGGSKALGALGYEWHVLVLKTLKKEYDAIKAEERSKGTLPRGYQKRLAEIDTFLRKEIKVRANHTELELRPLNLSIPPGVTFEVYKIKMTEEERTRIYSWWYDLRKAPLGEAEHRSAIMALNPDITAGQFLQYFPCYYQWAMNPTRSREQEILLDFCRHYLMVHRHVPLQKQENKVSFLCNILYRIAQGRDTFAAHAHKLTRGDQILNQARALSAPVLEIYQVRHATDQVLAGTSEVWETLQAEVPPPGTSMVALPCQFLADFSVTRLLSKCGLDKATEAQLHESCQQYIEHAKIFAGVQKITIVDAPLLRILSPAERKAGTVQGHALAEMKRIASTMLASVATRLNLQRGAQVLIDQLERERNQQLERILHLANLGPADAKQKLHRDLELEGGVRAPLDERRLLALYFRADRALYTLETGLSDAEITELHTQLSHYLAYSVRQQSLKRFCNQIDTAGSTPDSSTLQQIAHELLTENCVDFQTESVLALFQYYENVLLRPQQIEAIKRLLTSSDCDQYAFSETIIKIIMGGGKSKVILPVLAESKANGSNLVVIEVPRALFETNCADLANTSGRLFNQKAVPFEFNRDSDCTPESLEFLYSKLIDVIVRKDYLVTMGDAVQSLELKYLELLLQRPDDAKEALVWAKQVEWLDKIISVFRTRADVIMDEVHQALLLKKKLNYTLGDRRAVSPDLMTECVSLYQFFDHVSLGGVLAGKTLASVLENNHLLTREDQWKAAIGDLRQALVEHEKSPLKSILERLDPKLTDDDRCSLYAYLANEGLEIPACVERANPKIRNILALYKEQVSQLLTQTLKRKLNENYGASRLHPESGVALPYIANNVPSERSRFGNYLEAINYCIQMLMIEGFRPALLKQYLGQLQVQARQELLKDPSWGGIDNTPTAKMLRGAAPDFTLTLSEIHLDDPTQFDAIFSQLYKNKDLISDVLKTTVLPQIHVESEILHSDAYNHVDFYRSCQGITGTPSNSSTYHQRLTYNKDAAAATDGFILNVITEKHTPVHPVAHQSPEELLQGLFAGKDASESIRAVIDICATFKGIDNLDVGKLLANYVREHPTQFLTPAALKYILFFNAENVLCALDIQEGRTPILIGSTDPEVINTKLGCGPDARFSYYDQSHTVGVDLKQAKRAKALVLVDHETHLQSFLQGCLRMRGLQDEQSVDIIVPENLGALSLEALIQQMAANEERQLQQDNFTAAQAKMTNLIRADFMKRLLALPSDDVLKKHRFALAFKAYFVELASHDFFAVYGGLATMRPAKEILADQRSRLYGDWLAILNGLGETADLKMGDDLDKVVVDALPLCQAEYLSPTRQEQGKEVEVQKQVQIELQRETQLERELFNPWLEPEPYKPWTATALLQPYAEANDFLSLTAMCRRRDPTAPEFSEIYVSPNYYKSYKGQTQFMGEYLKPVHALLFRLRKDGTLDGLILSQQEADEITTIVKATRSSSLWLTTTRHTLLAGAIPAGIKENEAYHALMEQVRFFNGELHLLLDSERPPNWLSEGTGKKLEFFKQHLLPYRETEHQDLVVLRQTLSQRQNAFRYIAEHPFEHYALFEWRVHISEELTDADIEECEKLAKAFAYANMHWRENTFCRQHCSDGLHLSLQAGAYINRYVDEQLAILRGAFPRYAKGAEDEVKRDIDSLLPMLLKEYLPMAHAKKHTPLQYLLKTACTDVDNVALMRVAAWLVKTGADVNAINAEGRNALEHVIQHASGRVSSLVGWLLVHGADSAIHDEIWPHVCAETLEQLLVDLSVFRENDQFILACVVAFKNNAERLQSIMAYCPDSRCALQKVIEVVPEFSEEFLDVLLAHKLFTTDAMLLKQLLDKVGLETQQRILLQLVSIPNLSPEILEVIIGRDTTADFAINNKIIDLHYPNLQTNHLSALVQGLPKGVSEPLSVRFCCLLERIVGHAQATPAVLNGAVTYSLSAQLPLMLPFWGPFLKQHHWDRLDATALCTMYLALPDELRTDLLQSSIFLENQTEVINKFAEYASTDLCLQLLENSHVTLEPEHLCAMVRALPEPATQQKSPAEIMMLLQHIVSHEQVSAAVLESAIIYALMFVQEPLVNFWRDSLILRRWDLISAELIGTMFLSLPKRLIDELLCSTIFLDHRAAILEKMIENKSTDLFKVLLMNEHITLDSSELLLFLSRLDRHYVQETLPIVAGYKATHQDTLQKVIEMMVEPADNLLQVLLATDQFKKNDVLVSQLLAKVGQANHQRVIAALSSLSTSQIKPDVLTIVIKESKGDVKRLLQLMTTHDSHLDTIRLNAILQSLSQSVSMASPPDETNELLLRVTHHVKADPAIQEAAVVYALKFEPSLMERFWRDLSCLKWEEFNVSTVNNIVLKLPKEGVASLLRALLEVGNQKAAINKLIETGNFFIYRALLDGPDIPLEQQHLTSMMMRLDPLSLQALLPSIILHRQAEEVVLHNIILVMTEATESLVRALLANAKFTNNSRLVQQLLERLNAEQRQWMIVELSSMPGVGPDVLDVLIEKNDTSSVDVFHQILAVHGPQLHEKHLDAMVLAIASAKPVAVSTFKVLQQIIQHSSAETPVLERAVDYALRFDWQVAGTFWEKVYPLHWDRLTESTLCNLFIALPLGGVDHLFQSATFSKEREAIIDKLIRSANSQIYRILLENRFVRLEQRHLITCLQILDPQSLQAILPQMVLYPTTSYDLLRRIVELMREPSDELLRALLAHPQFVMTAEIIDRFISSKHQTVYRVLLENRRVKLAARHLIALMTGLDSQTVQGILPSIMVQEALDLDVLQKIIAVMAPPADHLLQLLLANPLVQTNAALVKQLLLRFDRETRQGIMTRLVNSSFLWPEVLTVFLDLDGMQALLPEIAVHAAAVDSVLQHMMEVMAEPTEEVLLALLANPHFLTNAELIEQVLTKIYGAKRVWFLSELSSIPMLQPQIVDVIIEKNKRHVDRLIQLYHVHGKQLSADQFIAMLPNSQNQARAWRQQKPDVVRLLLLILNHEPTEEAVVKAVIRCALSVVKLGAQFWRDIPEKMVKLDLSGNHLGHKSLAALKILFAAIGSATELDLSNNHFDEKEGPMLAEILATLPPNIERLNLSGNHIDSKLMPQMVAAIPKSVRFIAHQDGDYRPRAEIDATFTDYSFLFNCMASIAMVAGGVMLLLGLFTLNPILAGIGLSVMVTVATSAGLSEYGLFSKKPPTVVDEPDGACNGRRHQSICMGTP